MITHLVRQQSSPNGDARPDGSLWIGAACVPLLTSTSNRCEMENMFELQLFATEHQTHIRLFLKKEVGDPFNNVYCWHPVVRRLKMC